MRIYPLSDLHNEFSPFTPGVTDADVVILAGDIDLGVRASNGPGRHSTARRSLTRCAGSLWV